MVFFICSNVLMLISKLRQNIFFYMAVLLTGMKRPIGKKLQTLGTYEVAGVAIFEL